MKLFGLIASPAALLAADVKTIDARELREAQAADVGARKRADALARQIEDAELKRGRWNNATPGGAPISEQQIAELHAQRAEQLQIAAAARAAAANARNALRPRFAATVDPHRQAAARRIRAALAEVAAALEILEAADEAGADLGIDPGKASVAHREFDHWARFVDQQAEAIARVRHEVAA